MYPIRIALSVLTAFLIFYIPIQAQTNNPRVNSGEALAKGLKLHDEKKYKEAILEYEKIDRSDTNYVDALFELSYSYYADSQKQKSLELATMGMELYPAKYALFAMQAANSLDDLNKSYDALKLYDSALLRNPQSFLLYFNKGVVNYKLENYPEAKLNMQKCLLINPYYSSAHFYLGSVYYKDGNPVAALLAFQTYLLISPEGRYFQNIINMMSSIANVTDEVNKNVKESTKENAFSLQQEILLSKIALNKQYKLKADLEEVIVRQIQVVNEKLEYNKKNKDFAMQFYVPLYMKTFTDGHFEAMIFSILSNVNIKDIQNWAKNNKKEKQAFVDMAVDYMNEIKRTQEIDFSIRADTRISHISNNGAYAARGEYTKGEKVSEVGNWQYFHTNGALKAKGDFNDKGEKEGNWIYYYENGLVKDKSYYKNGVLEGRSEGWFDNGNNWFTENYINGKRNGMETMYYYNGVVKSISNLKEDLKTGVVKFFDIRGGISSSAMYANDILEGVAYTHFSNGKIKTDVNYKGGKENGIYKSYYASGALHMQGEYKDGLQQGPWITYFEDGTPSEKLVYQDNELTGEFTEYHPDGVLKTKGNYKKKKIDGKLESYDVDGKVFSDIIYENGKLREINFYDKSGKTISTTTTRKGAANIVFYSPDGLKLSEGFYNKEGDKDGKFIYYFASGKISQESLWDKGYLNGQQNTYHIDGKIKQTINFKKGELDGYNKDYYANGQLSSEGWKSEGDKQQGYLYYNKLGDLTTREYFLNDDLNGYSQYYNPGNKITYEYTYKTGWLTGIKQFDTTGNLINQNKLVAGNGAIVNKHYNGKIASSGTYRNYLLNGAYPFYFFDGSLLATSFYKNGQLDSIYKTYYYGGKLRSEGKYKNGNKEGKWKYYFPDGKINEEENFKDGSLDGVDKFYRNDGSLEKEITFKEDEMHGPYLIYGEKNQLALRLNYADGELQSYQYEEKAGILTSPVKLPGSTGKIEGKYPNQKQSISFHFMDNELTGERLLFYSNGNLLSKGQRLNGFVTGLYETYYLTGTKQSEENFLTGDRHGPSKFYYPNGKLERVENYYLDERHGETIYYNESGKLAQTRLYHYGVLINIK